MTLASLRPRVPTDLTQLSVVLQKQNASAAALPPELPEPFLLAVARDLRSLEEGAEVDDSSRTSLAAPMALVLCILFGSPTHRKSPISISEPALFASLKSYQWAVEREIITRLTGLGGRDDVDILLKRLAQITAEDYTPDDPKFV